MNRTAAPQEAVRVSTIELFFDLVFVFTVTQITHLVEHAHGALDLLRALLVLTLIWWIYDGYAWLTNDAGAQKQMRLVLIAAMVGFLVMALSIPGVFGEHGLAFGLAYLFVIVLHLVGFAVKGGRRLIRAVLGLAPFNVGAATLVIAAGLIDADWAWLLFLAAVSLFVLLTIFRGERGFSVNVPHFVERHGLIMIIALGESVVAIGTGAAGHALDLPAVSAVVLALLLIAALWWTYFDNEDRRAEHALMSAPPETRSRIALLGYWYAHLVMISGIVVIAAGVKHVLAHGEGPESSSAAAWALAGGMAVYLGGDVLFRWVVGIRPILVRAVGAVVAVTLGVVGLVWGGVVELGAGVALAVALLAIERRLE